MLWKQFLIIKILLQVKIFIYFIIKKLYYFISYKIFYIFSFFYLELKVVFMFWRFFILYLCYWLFFLFYFMYYIIGLLQVLKVFSRNLSIVGLCINFFLMMDEVMFFFLFCKYNKIYVLYIDNVLKKEFFNIFC